MSNDDVLKLRVPRPTLLDRAIGYFSPIAAAHRYRARMFMAAATSWTSASRTRPALKNWNPLQRDADSDNLSDIRVVRPRSRDAVRNIPFARGAIATNVTAVIGAGLQMRPFMDGETAGLDLDTVRNIERAAKVEWNTWANHPYSDALGKVSFNDLQGLAFRSYLENGDGFAITPEIPRRFWPYRLTVQLIEADRVSNPQFKHGEIALKDGGTIVEGVERDVRGEFRAIHVSSDHPGNMTRPARLTWQRIEVRGSNTGRLNVIHLHDPQRIGETRGVPYLAPVIEPLKQLTRYTDAELMAAVIGAYFTVFLESDQGLGFGGFGGPNAKEDQVAPSGQSQFELGAGAIVQLQAGQSAKFADPQRPSDSFDPFVLAILRQVGVALEIPYEILIKHFSSSYTAARASFQEFWRYVTSRRNFFARCFTQPIYDLFFEEIALMDRIDAPGFVDALDDPVIRAAYTGARWIGPPKGMINERIETESAVRRMQSYLSTLDEETAQATGGDWERNLEQSANERRTRMLLDLPIDVDSVNNNQPAQQEEDEDQTDANAANVEEE